MDKIQEPIVKTDLFDHAYDIGGHIRPDLILLAPEHRRLSYIPEPSPLHRPSRAQIAPGMHLASPPVQQKLPLHGRQARPGSLKAIFGPSEPLCWDLCSGGPDWIGSRDEQAERTIINSLKERYARILDKVMRFLQSIIIHSCSVQTTRSQSGLLQICAGRYLTSIL
jgi:hypothetical protein